MESGNILRKQTITDNNIICSSIKNEVKNNVVLIGYEQGLTVPTIGQVWTRGPPSARGPRVPDFFKARSYLLQLKNFVSKINLCTIKTS